VKRDCVAGPQKKKKKKPAEKGCSIYRGKNRNSDHGPVGKAPRGAAVLLSSEKARPRRRTHRELKGGVKNQSFNIQIRLRA